MSDKVAQPSRLRVPAASRRRKRPGEKPKQHKNCPHDAGCPATRGRGRPRYTLSMAVDSWISRCAFLDRPLVASPVQATAVGGKEPAAITPEKRPYLLGIRPGNGQRRHLGGGEETEFAFAMGRRQLSEARLDFKQKHEPMRLPFVAVFADDPGQMQIRRAQVNTNLLTRLAASAGEGRFASSHVELAAARTPKAPVRIESPMQKQRFIPRIEAVKERGYFV